MFDEQNNQQQQDDGGNQAQTDNPAAPPQDQQPTPPQQAYEAIFDDNSAQGGAAPTPDPNQTDQAQPQANTQPDQATNPVDEDGLLTIKKQALEQLGPLVSQLDQAPEEKFHTTMRIIQAADNHALIGEAHAAAKEIPDDKARAQALLDIVNEINYFTKDGSPAEHTQAA